MMDLSLEAPCCSSQYLPVSLSAVLIHQQDCKCSLCQVFAKVSNLAQNLLPRLNEQKWMNKHATLLQVTVMAIVATAAVTGTAASAGALGSVVASLALPFGVVVLEEAYEFLPEAGGEEMERMLGDISDALDPTKPDVGAPTNPKAVHNVTGAEYRSVLDFMDTKCQGWDRQMGGMERTSSQDGVVG